jgi:hypothetical protein
MFSILILFIVSMSRQEINVCSTALRYPLFVSLASFFELACLIPQRNRATKVIYGILSEIKFLGTISV